MYNYLKEKNMAEDILSQEFELKNTEETRDYLIEEINQNELMNKKHKKVGLYGVIFNTYLFSLLRLLDVFRFLLLLH